MASSKVMASRSPPNPDLPRQPSSSTLNPHSDHSRSVDSMSMDEILRNIYSDSDTFALDNAGGGSAAVEDRNASGNKTVDEVWREIVSGGGPVGGAEPGMTLEDFLVKAGVGNEEDVRVPAMAPPGVYGMEAVIMNPAAAVHFAPNGLGMEFGNGMSSGVSGRGKRKAVVEEAPLDKATQQKQRRMIKNRESAARSRERKQAYTVELESLVNELEKENARLLKEQAELNKKRYKQLVENLIPVVEKQRPPRILRRVQSMEW